MNEVNLVLLCSGIVIAGVVAGFVIYRHRNPAQAELAKALSDLRVYLSAKLEPVSAPQEAAAPVEAVVIPPAGKNGVAGLFTAPVTGDPAVDIPAITAAYYKG